MTHIDPAKPVDVMLLIANFLEGMDGIKSGLPEGCHVDTVPISSGRIDVTFVDAEPGLNVRYFIALERQK